MNSFVKKLSDRLINFNKINKKAAVTLLAAIFGVMIFSFSLSYAETNYEMPNFIRVYLTSYCANQSQTVIKNNDIKLGYFDYDDGSFKSLQEFSSSNGYAFMYNDSQRYVSSNVYEDYEDVLEILKDSDDYIPLLLGDGKYKILTKPNRESDEICDSIFNDLTCIVMVGEKKELAMFDDTEPVVMPQDEDEFIVLKSANGTERTYRGGMEFVVDSYGVSAINYVDFEEYLYGVVTCEMPKAWNFEAIKAQALTARTYALKRVLTYQDRDSKNFRSYDLVDTTSDQVYKGVTGESDNSIKATQKTTGEVIIYVGNDKDYKNKLIDAFFSSCHGGVSANSEDVWTAALPYCRSIVDKYEKPNAYTNWEITFTLSDLQTVMNRIGAGIGNVTGCTVTTCKDSERVYSFNVVGSKGTYKVSKDSVRSFFNKHNEFKGTCYSNNFELFSGESPEFEEVVTNNKINVLGTMSNKPSELETKSLFMFNSGNKGNEKISKAINVINGDNEITKLEIETTTKVEKEDTKMKKGTYKIIGSGYGHGVGMSQYGARDMADAGFDYDEIIKYYYQDVDIITIE